MDLKQKKLANTIGSAIGITLFILALAGVTYAFYRWTSSNINISGESTCFAVDYTKGPNIENESVILFDESTIINNNQITIKNGMALTGLTAGNSTCETSVELTVNLTINSLNNAFITGNSIGAFKYVVANYDPASYQTISTTSLIGETFDIIKSGSITSTNKIKLLTEDLTSTQKGYLVIFYVDGDLANNDASNSSFSATISAEASQYIKPPLATHITNLYLDNKDAQPVENNGISYRYARIYDNDNDERTSGGLMNDRHGSMDTGEDEGNIRYYGANPNNYIYFNCSDYSNQSESTCEVWRIIGVFDGKVKIMRNGSIGELAWDQDKNQDSSLKTYNNDWSTSSLQEFLNGKYYNREDDTSLTYYTGKDGSSSVSIDLGSIGIKNDETRRLISETLWYLRGWNNISIYSDQMYDYERNNGEVYNTSWSTTMPGKIAIPYASDYGYAADLGSCSGYNFSQYVSGPCTSVNWMKPILGNTSSGWLMAPYSSSSNIAWIVISSGRVRSTSVYFAYGVAPVLHINSELSIESGDGSEGNPYKLEVKTENKKETFVEYLTNKYMSANPTQATVANNGINYYYAPSVNMMNDGMGSNHTWEDGANAGNIRYYGANPNNYIDIGDVYSMDYSFNNWEKFGWYYSDRSSCELYNDCDKHYSDFGYDSVNECYSDWMLDMSLEEICGTTTISAGTPILYRVIGLFKNVELSDGSKKDLIKVVRDTPIGFYSWDQSPSDINRGKGINEWSQADLMKLLNPTYENEEVGGSLYWNSTSGNCYGYDYESELLGVTPCDFTNSGLSLNARNKIETVKWNLGLGGHNTQVFLNQMYKYERGENVVQNPSDGIERKKIWEGKVALAYPSDYGYAADFNNCSEDLDNYDNCIGDNWLYSSLTLNGVEGNLLLTPSSGSYSSWSVAYNGFVGWSDVNSAGGVFPVFYLDSALGISTGNGSKTTPYVVR